jgi:hypothetical protein
MSGIIQLSHSFYKSNLEPSPNSCWFDLGGAVSGCDCSAVAVVVVDMTNLPLFPFIRLSTRKGVKGPKGLYFVL